MDEQSFLKKIAQLESSGGKNTKHKKITKGLQKNQTAVGSYGLLPNTMEEMLKRSKMDIGPKTEEITGAMDVEDQAALSDAVAKNPELERQLASRLYEHIAKKTDDPEKMAYMWNSGHNADPEKMGREILTNPYVQKFNAEMLKDKPALAEEFRNINTDEQDPKLVALERLMRGR